MHELRLSRTGALLMNHFPCIGTSRLMLYSNEILIRTVCIQFMLLNHIPSWIWWNWMNQCPATQIKQFHALTSENSFNFSCQTSMPCFLVGCIQFCIWGNFNDHLLRVLGAILRKGREILLQVNLRINTCLYNWKCHDIFLRRSCIPLHSTFKSENSQGVTSNFHWQGFNWESHKHDWWRNLVQKVPDIAKSGFTSVWLPPATHSVSSEGSRDRSCSCFRVRF